MTDHPSTTIARLREVLGKYFGRAEIRTYLQRLREAGLLPRGDGSLGRGAGSAEVNAEHAAMLLFALASSAAPIAASVEAQRIAGFRMHRLGSWTEFGWGRRVIAYDPNLTFIDHLVFEIECGADVGWGIASRVAIQHTEDLIPDDTPLVVLPRPRLIFAEGGKIEPTPSDEKGRPLAIERLTIIPAQLIEEIGELFRTERADAA
jgi:hypothetical protein